jgi:hypothetical protein
VLDWSVDWSRDGHSARVVQSAGEVFYRVEAGGPFTVETPYAAVTVTGTCFKVEVTPMASNRGLVAAAAAGALVGGLLVTVYEGHVRVQNAQGALEASAGDRVHAGQAAAPGFALEPTPAGLMATPPGAAPQTPEAVAAREQAAQVQVAALQARVRTLEQERGALAARLASAATGPLRGEPNDGRPPQEKYRDFTQAELRALAEKCELRTDLPPLQPEPWTMSPEVGAQLHLSDAEQATANAALNRLREDAVAKVRALYVEATGDAAGAETLELATLGHELLQKGGSALAVQARTRLAQEKAGLIAPPADLSKTSPQERYLRLTNGLAEALQRDLEKSLGAQQAGQVRDVVSTWHWVSNGCAN